MRCLFLSFVNIFTLLSKLDNELCIGNIDDLYTKQKERDTINIPYSISSNDRCFRGHVANPL